MFIFLWSFFITAVLILFVAIRKAHPLHHVSGKRLRRMQLDAIIDEGESLGLGVEFMVDTGGKLERVAGWNRLRLWDGGQALI